MRRFNCDTVIWWSVDEHKGIETKETQAHIIKHVNWIKVKSKKKKKRKKERKKERIE
jgi:hypothetical protein